MSNCESPILFVDVLWEQTFPSRQLARTNCVLMCNGSQLFPPTNWPIGSYQFGRHCFLRMTVETTEIVDLLPIVELAPDTKVVEDTGRTEEEGAAIVAVEASEEPLEADLI